MAKTKSTTKKKVAKAAPSPKTRKLQTPKYKSFRLQKRIKSPKPKLPSVKTLASQTLDILGRNKKFFLIYTLLYAVCSFIFIQTANSGFDIEQAKDLIGATTSGTVQASVVLYLGLLGTSTQFSNQIVGLYQFIIILIFSLAVIYGLRHMYGREARYVSVKESLYKGMTPLVPILLVLAVIALQLLPLSIGTSMYATVVNSGLAVTDIERIMWVVFVALTALLSLYLVSSSVFALFVVTLPDMTPMRALRATRELVRHRRLEVIRKLVVLPVALLILIGLVVVPFIAFLPAVAQIVFFVASTLVLPVALTYLYNLYRSML